MLGSPPTTDTWKNYSTGSRDLLPRCPAHESNTGLLEAWPFFSASASATPWLRG